MSLPLFSGYLVSLFFKIHLMYDKAHLSWLSYAVRGLLFHIFVPVLSAEGPLAVTLYTWRNSLGLLPPTILNPNPLEPLVKCVFRRKPLSSSGWSVNPESHRNIMKQSEEEIMKMLSSEGKVIKVFKSARMGEKKPSRTASEKDRSKNV